MRLGALLGPSSAPNAAARTSNLSPWPAVAGGPPLFLGSWGQGVVRAVVSTIQLGKGLDLGALRDKLRRFADAGFDDGVVMFLPGGPTPE